MQIWVFLCIKYGKFWSVSLELFVKHKLWNWEEWKYIKEKDKQGFFPLHNKYYLFKINRFWSQIVRKMKIIKFFKTIILWAWLCKRRIGILTILLNSWNAAISNSICDYSSSSFSDGLDNLPFWQHPNPQWEGFYWFFVRPWWNFTEILIFYRSEV